MTNPIISQLLNEAQSGKLTTQDFLAIADVMGHTDLLKVIKKFSSTELSVNLDFDASTIPAEDLSIGAIIDTETTGKLATDVIIELGIVKFHFNNKTGEIYTVIDKFSGLNDPGDIPIDPAATEVSGLSIEDVRGHSIDLVKLEAFLQDITILIAHNSLFDRPKCEALLPAFANIRWACSMRDIQWKNFGIVGSSKLEYIAYMLGFFFDAHRAVEDCFALLNVLSKQAVNQESGETQFIFKNILDAVDVPKFKIWATNAPFHAKDTLKTASYFWNDGTVAGSEKAWAIEVSTQEDLESQISWLSSAVFENKPASIVIDNQGPLDKFSSRRGQTVKHMLNVR